MEDPSYAERGLQQTETSAEPSLSVFPTVPDATSAGYKLSDVVSGRVAMLAMLALDGVVLVVALLVRAGVLGMSSVLGMNETGWTVHALELIGGTGIVAVAVLYVIRDVARIAESTWRILKGEPE